MKAVVGMLSVLGLLAFFCTPAFAADASAPDKAGLVSFWEQAVKSDPHVSRFEKTREAGVYDFATDFFPYKGRLKLLNAVVTKTGEGYLDGLYTGIIEVELLDAAPDFFKKYSASYGAWTQQNYFYYHAKKGWFPLSDYSAYSAELYKSDAAAPTASACPLSSSLVRYATTWGPIVFLILVIAVVIRVAKKQNARIWDNHAKALAEQQRGLKMVEESLKHQQEHTLLLREIAAALKK
jgi:cbb3-type cytochrome oxidase subunit 3